MVHRLPLKINTELFLLAVGTILVLTGVSLFLFPSEVISPAYELIWRHRDLFGTVFTLSGITFFILHSYPWLHRLLQWLLAVIISAPIFIFAYAFFKSGAIPGFASWTILGLSSLMVPPLRYLSATDEEIKEVNLIVLVASLVMVVVGGSMILFPGSFPEAIYAPIKSFFLPLGLAFLVGSGLFGASIFLDLEPLPKTLLHLTASLPFLLFIYFLIRINAFSGVIIYGIPLLLLIVQPLLAKQHFPHELDGYPLTRKQLRLARFEQVNEAASWGVALLLIVLGLFPRWLDINQAALYLLVLAYSLYLIIWYHFISPELLSGRKVVASLSVFAIFAAVINHFTGALESPFFFLYFIPIIAAGYALSPRALLTPLVIVVLALNFEWLLAISQNGFNIFGAREAVFAAFRYASLVLVGLFAYGLSKTHEENNKIK